MDGAVLCLENFHLDLLKSTLFIRGIMKNVYYTIFQIIIKKSLDGAAAFDLTSPDLDLVNYTVCPNKKETRFISEISALPRKI